MNDDDDLEPIERRRVQVEEQLEEEKETPLTFSSLLQKASILVVGTSITEMLFQKSEAAKKETISPVEDEFVIDTEHFKCNICNDYYAAHHVVECNKNIGHRICQVCFAELAKYSEKLGDVVCPVVTCRSVFQEYVFDICLDQETKSRLLKQQHTFDRTIALHNNVERALYCKCGYVAVIEKSAVGDGTVKCVCGEKYCLKCGNYVHEASLCPPPPSTLRAETASWIKWHTKKCPSCSQPIEKNLGCNHMTCRQCKYNFCWLCLGPWSPKCNCIKES